MVNVVVSNGSAYWIGCPFQSTILPPMSETLCQMLSLLATKSSDAGVVMSVGIVGSMRNADTLTDPAWVVQVTKGSVVLA